MLLTTTCVALLGREEVATPSRASRARDEGAAPGDVAAVDADRWLRGLGRLVAFAAVSDGVARADHVRIDLAAVDVAFCGVGFDDAVRKPGCQ